MSDENTLRDVIESAVNEAEAAPVEAPEQTEAEAKAERARDEQGRFAKAEAKEAEQQAEPVKEARRPSSWKKDYWPLYEKLDKGEPLTPEESKRIADYALQRETEFASGVSTYKSEAEKAKAFYQVIEPYQQRFQQAGISPQEGIARLLHIDNVLRTGTLEQRQDMLGKIAASAGLSLNMQGMPQEQQIDPRIQNLYQTQQQMASEWQQFMANQRAMAEAQVNREVEQFKATAPHFDAVIDQMARLLDAGLADDIQSAYKQAVRLRDDLYEADIQAKANEAKQQEIARKQEAAARAKANTVSVKSASPTGTGSAPNGDLRSTISSAFESLGVGRI